MGWVKSWIGSLVEVLGKKIQWCIPALPYHVPPSLANLLDVSKTFSYLCPMRFSLRILARKYTYVMDCPGGLSDQSPCAK